MSNLCHYENGVLIRCAKNTVKTIKNPFCQHCGGDLRKPNEIVPGMFGKFWDDGGGHTYDYLLEKSDEEMHPYIDLDGNYWEYFKPGFPEERIEVEETE